MAAPERLMAAGCPPLLARELGWNSGNGLLTANGTTTGTGTSLVAGFNLFGTVASGGIALLPAAESMPVVTVYNGGSNALSVQPIATEIINAGSVGVGFSVTAGKSATFTPGKNTAVTPPIGAWIANLSA